MVTNLTASASPLLRHPRPDRERRKQQTRVAPLERYEAVQSLVKQGLSHREISRCLHLHRESVIRYAKAKAFPERTERPASPGILRKEGEHNAVGLFLEVTACGYTGSRMTIERFLLGLRRMEKQGINVSTTATTIEVTPRRAVGLMLHRSHDLTKEESLALSQICQLHPQVEHFNALFQQFAQMLRDRREEELDSGFPLLFILIFLNYELL